MESKLISINLLPLKKLIEQKIYTMKKLILLLASFLCIANIWAYDFEVDGIYYDLKTEYNSSTYTYDSVACATYKAFAITYTTEYIRTDYSGDITIPSSVTYNGKTYQVIGISYNIFSYCKNITSVTIPATTKYFYHEGDSYGQLIADMFAIMFNGCSNLTSITVNSGHASLSSENGVLFNKNKTRIIAYPKNKTGNYIIPATVTRILTQAFYECTGLTSIAIPAATDTLWNSSLYYYNTSNPFEGCSNLTSITVDAGNTKYTSENGVLFNNNKTRIISYPGGLSGAYTIPSNVTSIGYSAFSNCYNLSSITIPSTIDTISEFAFSECTGLTTIDFPSSVTYINYNAFKNCTNLKSITINGDSVEFEDDVFAGCKSITQITCKGKYPPTSKSAESVFGDDELSKAMIYAQARLSIPAASFKLYRLMEPWKNFDTEAYDFDMQVVSATNSAAFTWTPTTGAEKYELTVCSDAANTDTICILTFNAYGQLTALALRSTSSDSTSYIGGFSFTVTSLNNNTDYYYSMSALNSSDQVVANKTGGFRTTTTTDIENASAYNLDVTIQNGKVLVSGIDAGEQVAVYNLQGMVVFTEKASASSVEFKLPSNGMYIVKVGSVSKKILF